MPEKGSEAELPSEFDRQLENLIGKGYPELAGLQEDAFRQHVAPLRKRLPEPAGDGNEGRTPFVIVISSELVRRDRAMPLVELGGKRGFTTMEADDLERFTPLAGVEIPPGAAYLAADIDTGRDTLNVTPDEAIKTITGAHRSPLTIDEGVALITHHPDLLKTRNCFSMLASRCGDRRVAAMWVSDGRPRLGWCWAGNPHTWLGSASCGSRVASPV